MKGKFSIRTVAVNNLKVRTLRTSFMVFFVILMAGTFFFSSVLMKNLDLSIRNTTERMGADLIVVPDEGTEEIRQSLFAGTPCSLYFDRAPIESMEVEGIARMSPQLYVATMAATCCDAPVQLIAFDPETDFAVTPWLEANNVPELGNGEIIIGYNIAADVGESLTFFDTEFRVAAKLEKSGMGYDDSVFMSFETICRLKESEVGRQNLPADNLEEVISMMLVDTEEGVSRGIVQIDIQDNYPGEERMRAVTADELMGGLSDQVSRLTGYGSLLTGLMVFSTALALISIFVLTINERRHEFGVLYTLGANRMQVSGIVLWEAMLISLTGGLAGVSIVWGIMALFRVLIGQLLNIPFMNVGAAAALPAAVLGVGIALVTGVLAAICASRQIAKKEPYRLIRENE